MMWQTFGKARALVKGEAEGTPETAELRRIHVRRGPGRRRSPNRFVAVFSGSVAREGEFLSDEVEHGGHVFHRPVPAGFALHG